MRGLPPSRLPWFRYVMCDLASPAFFQKRANALSVLIFSNVFTVSDAIFYPSAAYRC